MIACNVGVTWTMTQHPGKDTFQISVGLTEFLLKSTTSISLYIIQFFVMTSSAYDIYGTCIMNLKQGPAFAIVFVLIQLQIIYYLMLTGVISLLI